MIGRLEQRGMARLSYLMASVATSPEMAVRLILRVLKESNEREGWFRSLLLAVSDRISSTANGRAPTICSVRKAAMSLMRDPDQERNTVGRILVAALESSPITRLTGPS